MIDNRYSNATAIFVKIFRKCLFQISCKDLEAIKVFTEATTYPPEIPDVSFFYKMHKDDEEIADAARFICCTVYALHILPIVQKQLMWAILNHPKYEIPLNSYSHQSRSRKFREAEIMFFELVSDTTLLESIEKVADDDDAKEAKVCFKKIKKK